MVSLLSTFTPWILALFLLSIDVHVAGQNCYYPNGDLSTEGDGACSSDGGVCCPLNWACLSNGLCYLESEGFYGRYTCTDQSWQSGTCPQLCTQDNTASGNEAILQCADGSWCCDGNRSSDCCNKDGTDYFSLPQGNQIAFISSVPSPTSVQSSVHSSVVASPPSASSSSYVSSSPAASASSTSNTRISSSSFSSNTPMPSTMASSLTTITEHSISTGTNGAAKTVTLIRTATPISPADSSSSPSSSHKSSTPIGLIVGLAVGIPVLLGLAGVGFFFWRKRRNARSTTPPPYNDKHSEYGTAYGHFPPEGREPELDSHPVAPTRSKSGRASELDGSSKYSPSVPPFSPNSDQRVSLLSNENSPGQGFGASPELKSVNEEPAELWGSYVPYRPPQTTTKEDTPAKNDAGENAKHGENET